MKEQKPMKFFPVFKSVMQIVILSIIIFTFALTVSVSESAQNPKNGGKLVFGVENEPAGFDVIKARGLAVCDAIIANTVMERLFDMDDEGNLIPELGLSVKPLDDGKTWMVVLRKGVSFHDGTPFNADAVVLHWNRMLNPENRYRGLSLLSTIVSVSKVDEHTVQFLLKHPWEPFPRVLCAARTLTNLIPSPKAVDEGKQMRAPVGTGPFMFKEWKSGDQVVVVKNPNYWQ